MSDFHSKGQSHFPVEKNRQIHFTPSGLSFDNVCFVSGNDHEADHVFQYRIVISLNETTVESRFFEPPRETKIGSKNRRVREIGGETTVFD